MNRAITTVYHRLGRSNFCRGGWALLAAFVVFILSIVPAVAQDGTPFDAPFRVNPDRGKEIRTEATGAQEGESASTNALYRLEAYDQPQRSVSVFRNSDNVRLLNITFTGDAAWGFSPDQHRFVIHFYDGTQHTIRMYNLQGAQPDAPPVWPVSGTPDSMPWTATSSRVAFSKDGKYLFYAAMDGASSFSLRVVEAATGAVRHRDNYYGTFTGTGAGWGFSPDEDRFLIHYYDGDAHKTRLYNLDGAQPDNAPVWSDDVQLDGGDTSRLWFSRHGEYLLYVVLKGGNQLTKWVVDTGTGSVPYDTIPSITIGQPPGHEGDRIDSATWGFTRDASAFFYAYYKPDGQVAWGLVALPSGNHSMGPTTFSAVWDRWRFSHSGDAIGIAWWTNTNLGIRLVRLSDGAELYRSETFPRTTEVEFRTTDTLYIAIIDGVQYNLALLAGEDTEAPTWPSGSSMSFSNVKHSSLTVSWPAANDNIGVTEYRLFRDGDEIALLGSDERTYDVTGLSAQTAYTFAVEALDGAGNRSARLQRSTTTPQAPPPTWPSGSALSATQLERCPPFQVLLEWNAAEDEDAVTAYRVYQDGVRIHTLEVQGEPDEVSYVVPGLETGLELGETYTFRIQAGNAAGSWTTNGPQRSIEIIYLPPPCWHPDAELLVPEVGPRHVTIQWPEAIQADNVVRYEYFRSYTYMGSIDPSVTNPVDGFFSASITGLWWDTEYTFRIVAYDEDGNVSEFLASEPVRTLDRDKTDPPEWPPGSALSVSAMSSTELTLNWTEAEDEDGVGYYQVFMGNTRIATVPGSQTAYEVTGLRPGREYVFTVQAGDHWDNWTTDGPSLTVTTDTDPPEPEVMPERELIISFPFPEGQYWDPGSGGAVPVLSGDGNIVAFTTRAANLVPGVANGYRQVYVYNRQTDELEVVSVSSGGALGDNHSFTPALSVDGRYVAFASSATNLHPRAEDSWSAVYVRDRETNTTEMVSLDILGQPLESIGGGPLNPPTISADGRFVVFGGYLHDRIRRRTEPINYSPIGHWTYAEKASISADGRYVVFTTNTHGGSVRVYDRWSGRMIMVTDDDGLPPDISGDGNVVVHETRPEWYDHGGDPYRLFAHDVQTGETEFITWASTSAMAFHEDKAGPVVNHTGRYVAFSSENPNLDPCGFRLGKDVYIYDRWESEIELISYFSREEYWGGPNNLYPSISADGQMVAFENMYWDYDLEQYMAHIYWHKRGNVDVRPPCWHWSVPFDAIEIGEDYATLHWGRASDNVGVTAYRLYQDDVLIATLDAEDEFEFHEYTVSGLVEDQPYVFTVQAGDAAGNWSTDGPTVEVILGDWFWITTAMEPSEVGGIHLAETGPFKPGTEIEIRATTRDPHRFLYWTAPAGEFADPEAAETVFTMPDQHVTITANIGVDDRGAIRVSIEPAAAREAGALWGLSLMQSWYSSGYALYPLPLGEYTVVFNEIDGWIRPENVSVSIYELETTILTATYLPETAEEVHIYVTANPAAGGEVEGGGTYEYGQEATVSAEAHDGYVFAFWSENSQEVSPHPTYVFTATSDRELVAQFVVKEYALQYTAGENGSLEGDVEQTVEHGSSGTAVTAIPDDGYHFTQWSDGVTDNPRTDANVTGDISVSASFAVNAGALQVVLEPEEAVDAGAYWRRKDTSVWHSSSSTEDDIPVGVYEVEFRPVSGWATPDVQEVTIEADEMETIVATYVQKGSLKVTIEPPAAVDAGAQWRRVGTTAWRDSGVTETNVSADDHEIEFKHIDGWNTPGAITVSVPAGGTGSGSGTYTLVSTPDPDPDPDPSPGIGCGGRKMADVLGLDSKSAPTVYEPALPATRIDANTRLAAMDSTLAVRLRAEEAIAPETVWGVVSWSDGHSEEVYFVYAEENADGWAVYAPDAPWNTGDEVTFTAGAETVSGAPVGPKTLTFIVTEEVNAEEMTLTAAYSHPDGVGQAWQIGPDALFEEPVTVQIPVPTGYDLSALEVGYHFVSDADAQLVSAEKVEGWLVPDSVRAVSDDDSDWIELTVRHGGIVQLKQRTAQNAPAGLSTSIPPGDLLVLLAMTGIIALAAAYRRRMQKS